MEFKNMPLKSILLVLLAAIFLIVLMVLKFSCKADVPAMASTFPNETPMAPPAITEAALGPAIEEDAAIQEQLDHDRQQQKRTKELKIKLEQTNLELEQEKALAQINDLKKENTAAFNDPTASGQSNLPEIKVDYIGGDTLRNEAIISIAGISYQVKQKSQPTDNIQVVDISDSSVTLHFSAPQDLTKTIDYKPE